MTPTTTLDPTLVAGVLERVDALRDELVDTIVRAVRIALAEAGIRLAGDLVPESVVGEEVMDHECGVTATVKRGCRADAAVVSEPSAPPSPLAVIPVSPGLLWFSVTVPGRASHASMRGQTIRAGGAGAAVGDLRVAHAPDEYVDIDEVMAAARTFAVLAMSWCGVA